MMVRRSKYTKEVLTEAAMSSTSMASCIKYLGLKLTGGNYSHIQSLLRYYAVDTNHFTGKGWAKGKSCVDNESLRSMVRKTKIPDEEVFIKNSYPVSGSKLVKRLLSKGWVYCCNACGNTGSWLGNPLTLHLDHINGVHNDNRLENLRFLCPNCHQQTHTWGNKVRNKSPSGETGNTGSLEVPA